MSQSDMENFAALLEALVSVILRVSASVASIKEGQGASLPDRPTALVRPSREEWTAEWGERPQTILSNTRH